MQRASVFQDAEQNSNKCCTKRNQYCNDNPGLLFVLVIGFLKESKRTVHDVRPPRNHVAGTQRPRLAGEARVLYANQTGDVSDFAATHVAVGVIVIQFFEVSDNLVELTLVEVVRRA